MPLFSANLRGGGTARVFFGVNTFGVSGPRLIAHDLHYVFETQPVPEPSTLLLVGAGLGAALTRCRTTRRPAEIALIDSSVIADVSDVHRIITDDGADPKLVAALRARNIEVMVV